MAPLFIPLRGVWFDAFARHEKTKEWRRYGPRWNEKVCVIGRAVVLSRGYSGARIKGRIVGFTKRRAKGAVALIYGYDTPCAVLTLALDS